MCFTHSFFHFTTLRKSLQATSTSPYRRYMILTLSIYLQPQKQCLERRRQFYPQPQNTVLGDFVSLSATSKTWF
ncbi:Uncharacterised protein [Streptococcus pneumoniae]|nr:Uncharacterised protein [Streptococcus pneumoniae]